MSDIFKSMCRLCMHVGNSMIPIFSEDELSNITETIVACVPQVIISRNDGLPENICLKCSVRLNDAFTFKQLCESSDTILRKLVDESLSVLQYNEYNKCININSSNQGHEVIDPINLIECSLQVITENDLAETNFELTKLKHRAKNIVFNNETENNKTLSSLPSDHIKEEVSEMPIKMEEELQNEKASEELNASEKLIYKTKCKEKIIRIVEEVKEKVEKKKIIKDNRVKSRFKTPKLKMNKYRCHMCNEDQFSSIKELKDHRSTHQGPFKCKYCERELSTWRARINHERTHTNEKRSTQCNICLKVFKTFKRLSRHKTIHTGVMKTSCPLCDKEFAHKGNLTRHMLTHQNVKPYACEICHTRFTQAVSLKAHMICHSMTLERHPCPICKYSNIRKAALRAHMISKHLVRIDSERKGDDGNQKIEKLGTYQCSDCDRVLSSAQTLKIHMKTHTGLKEYLCRHCGRPFSSKTGLDIHERIHTGEKPFVCNLCSKRFTQQIGLTTHILTHTGEKPHKCKVCFKCFSQGSHLRTHMKTHTGERKHVCDMCNKAFAQREGLRYHKMTHTGETPFVCQFCGRGFYIQYKLKVHLDKNHGFQIQDKSKNDPEISNQEMQKTQEILIKENIFV